MTTQSNKEVILTFVIETSADNMNGGYVVHQYDCQSPDIKDVLYRAKTWAEAMAFVKEISHAIDQRHFKSQPPMLKTWLHHRLEFSCILLEPVAYKDISNW